MKKLIIAAAVIISTVAFTSCTKENVQPTPAAHKANVLADKGTLSQADFTTDPDAPVSGDKGTLSQADGAN
ncbi:MAG: hypothetical protein V4592_19390 [Bacteroidota bacterium]